jgi:predicted dehydrogenase
MPPFALNADVYSPVRLEAFAAQVEGFAASIEAGGSPGMAGEDGRAAVELVEAAARSSASGTAVRLPIDA